MREFGKSVTVGRMHRLSLFALALALGCHAPEYYLFHEQQEKFASESGDSDDSSDAGTTGDAQPTSAGPVGSDSADASAGDEADATDTGAPPSDTAIDTGDMADTGDATDTEDSPPVVNPDKPTISDVELPDHVYAAGPVPITVHTEHTGSVSVRLDGADLGTLIDEGGGLFTGALPVLGAVDEGWHDVIVTAKQGPHEVSQPDGFTVQAPAPGTEVWSLAGPGGLSVNSDPLRRTTHPELATGWHAERTHTRPRPSLTSEC